MVDLVAEGGTVIVQTHILARDVHAFARLPVRINVNLVGRRGPFLFRVAFLVYAVRDSYSIIKSNNGTLKGRHYNVPSIQCQKVMLILIVCTV